MQRINTLPGHMESGFPRTIRNDQGRCPEVVVALAPQARPNYGRVRENRARP